MRAVHPFLLPATLSLSVHAAIMCCALLLYRDGPLNVYQPMQVTLVETPHTTTASERSPTLFAKERQPKPLPSSDPIVADRVQKAPWEKPMKVMQDQFFVKQQERLQRMARLRQRSMIQHQAVIPHMPSDALGTVEHSNHTESPATQVTQQKAGVRYVMNDPPPYPRLARMRGWEGTVLVRVVVRPDGRPRNITVLRSSGHEILDQAAIDAVQSWLFVPARDGNIPLTSMVEVPIRFNLNKHG